MLTITKALFQGMGKAMLLENEREIQAILRDACSLDDARWDEARLTVHTREGFDRALANGLRKIDDVVGFLVLRHAICDRFDEFPMIRRFFQDKASAAAYPDDRIYWLMRTVPLRVWEIIKRRLPNEEGSLCVLDGWRFSRKEAGIRYDRGPLCPENAPRCSTSRICSTMPSVTRKCAGGAGRRG